MAEVFDLCKSLNGRCGCEETGARGCDAILHMLEDGVTEGDERERMEQERSDAAGDFE